MKLTVPVEKEEINIVIMNQIDSEKHFKRVNFLTKTDNFKNLNFILKNQQKLQKKRVIVA